MKYELVTPLSVLTVLSHFNSSHFNCMYLVVSGQIYYESLLSLKQNASIVGGERVPQHTEEAEECR